MHMKIVIATNNKHKLNEYQEMVKDYNIEFISLKEAGIASDPEENGLSFNENASIKAKEASKFTTFPLIADDSGLVVDALPDILGIYTARFAKNFNSQSEANQKVISLLGKAKTRDAHFHCSIALANINEKIVCFEGDAYGRICEKEEGNNGFGYDPIFFSYELNKCFALVPPEIKNKFSHRGKALEKLVNYLKENKYI